MRLDISFVPAIFYSYETNYAMARPCLSNNLICLSQRTPAIIIFWHPCLIAPSIALGSSSCAVGLLLLVSLNINARVSGCSVAPLNCTLGYSLTSNHGHCRHREHYEEPTLTRRTSGRGSERCLRIRQASARTGVQERVPSRHVPLWRARDLVLCDWHFDGDEQCFPDRLILWGPSGTVLGMECAMFPMQVLSISVLM